MARPGKEMTRPLIGAIPTPLPAAAPGPKPRRQVTGGVELPGFAEIIEEARKQDEADIEASSPPPASLADLPPTDPEENILTSPFVASLPAPDHVDLDSMFEDDLVQTGSVTPPPEAPAEYEMDLELQLDLGGPSPPVPAVVEPARATPPPTGNEVLELELDATAMSAGPTDDGPRGIELWRILGEDGAAATKADILRRIRAGELGPHDRVARADEPDDDQSWELADVPEFKRYVMLFGRSGPPSDAGKRPFWKRFRRS